MNRSMNVSKPIVRMNPKPKVTMQLANYTSTSRNFVKKDNSFEESVNWSTCTINEEGDLLRVTYPESHDDL